MGMEDTTRVAVGRWGSRVRCAVDAQLHDWE